jgi:hypothetical protein
MAQLHLKLVAPAIKKRRRAKNADLRTCKYLTETEVQRLRNLSRAFAFGPLYFHIASMARVHGSSLLTRVQEAPTISENFGRSAEI